MTDDEAKRIAFELERDVLRRTPLHATLSSGGRALEAFRFLMTTGAVVEPLGHNDGVPRYLFCNGELDDMGNGYAYCAASVIWSFRMAGHPFEATERELRAMWEVAALFAYLLSRHAILPAGSALLGGDILFCYGRGKSDPLASRGLHHCGLVESVDGDFVHSIEGNWGNKLARVTRRLDDKDFAGFGRW